MKSGFGMWLASALALCAVWSAAYAAPIGANIAVGADSADGRSIDADFSVSPSEFVTLRAGAGYSAGSDETADLRGTLLSGGVSLHGERLGLDVDYDVFDDSTNYHAATLAARAWFTAGDFELALLARRRDMSVTFSRELPRQTIRRELEFGALGAMVYLTYGIGRAAWAQEPGGVLAFTGWLLSAVATVHDIMLDNGVLAGPNLIPFGFLAFFLCLSV